MSESAESESRLRCLFDNLPDLVLTVDRNATIRFANRGAPGLDRELLLGTHGFDMLIPEHREAAGRALEEAFASGQPQTVVVQNIFGNWWSSRLVVPAKEDGDPQATIICTDITQERLVANALCKEKQLLRQLLDLHERERQLTAYEIHDGFAQQLTGALFRLQAFRETHAASPAEAWKSYDSAVRLIRRAIDETRRLISGLRPPILDESGVIQAIEYLVYEHQRHDGPKIEFVHEVAFDRLAPPLESAIFRIVQESLQNACRHSRSDRVCVELAQHGDQLQIDVQDWGVGFSTEMVEERRFGLQGIRERARLLDGRVVIESAAGKGTHIRVHLPLLDSVDGQPESMEPRKSVLQADFSPRTA